MLIINTLENFNEYLLNINAKLKFFTFHLDCFYFYRGILFRIKHFILLFFNIFAYIHKSQVKMKKKEILILLFLFSVLGPLFSQEEAYSFFIAGHVYGTPGVNNVGFHPPFKAKFDYIKSRSEIKFGVLLGDIVIWPSVVNWDEVDAEIDTLGLPVYFAPGNHDMGDREMFESRYGDPYFSFIFNNDLFIILDPNIDHWNISGDQLLFVQNTLIENAANVSNIFVMSHQLIWWADDNIYSGITLNSTDGRADEINFWTDVEPLFNELSNNVYFCAGDVGAAGYASSFMYDNYDNISLIATGMGKNTDDNFIVINVDTNKNISYDFICLNEEELFCLGNLEDYKISNNEIVQTDLFSVYPNPASENFSILLEQDSNIKSVSIYDLNGKKVFITENIESPEIYFESNNIDPGVYFIVVISNNKTLVQKLIVL